MKANCLFCSLVALATIGFVSIIASGIVAGSNVVAPVDLEPLFLDVNDFPQGWSEDQRGLVSDEQAPFGGADYQFQKNITFLASNNIAFQDVRMFRRAAAAAQEFERQSGVRYRSDFGVWEPPTDLTFQSLIAKRYRLECRGEGVDRYCVMVAQYELLVVSFGARIGSSLTHGEFQSLLRSIELRFQTYLFGGDTHNP